MSPRDPAPRPEPTDQLLTLPQVAERLQVSLDTVRRLVRRREIASVNVGARAIQHRVALSEIDRFIAERTTPVLRQAIPGAFRRAYQAPRPLG